MTACATMVPWHVCHFAPINHRVGSITVVVFCHRVYELRYFNIADNEGDDEE